MLELIYLDVTEPHEDDEIEIEDVDSEDED